MALLELSHITAGYDKNIILRDFNLSVNRGDFVSLLGSSGCGKTTTLRLIAGFSEPNEGTISFDGKDITHVPLHKRNFGFVFQSYALFPHMTVFDNVAFGLKMRKVPKAEIRTRVMDMLRLVDLEGFESRYPREMSGGQRQRVALARAMVIRPDLMLFDEPLSNLDAKLRVKMRVEIRRLQQELGFTAIYVTHDQEECFAISDQVAIMNGGVIEQMDTPAHIFNAPKTEFIAHFVGLENFFRTARPCMSPSTAAGMLSPAASVPKMSRSFPPAAMPSTGFPAKSSSPPSSAGPCSTMSAPPSASLSSRRTSPRFIPSAPAFCWS